MYKGHRLLKNALEVPKVSGFSMYSNPFSWMQLEEGLSKEFDGPYPDLEGSKKWLNLVLVGPFTDDGKIATGIDYSYAYLLCILQIIASYYYSSFCYCYSQLVSGEAKECGQICQALHTDVH